MYPLRREMLAELVGSYILCFFGPGSIAVAVLVGEHQGLWQVASVWGFAIALAVYAVGAVSGAHLNPAVTLAMTLFRGFSPRKIAPYVGAQMIGGVLAASTLFILFNPICVRFEAQHQPPIVRGAPGSQLSAMWFGEYFPNPAAIGTDPAAMQLVTPGAAFLAEALGTALLLFFIMALTDRHNGLAPAGARLHPFLIGFAVAIIIAILAPLTQAGLNPMRDFAPRIVAYFAGWGSIAIPGPRGFDIWIYILAPLLGGPLGAAVYQALGHGKRVAESLEAQAA